MDPLLTPPAAPSAPHPLVAALRAALPADCWAMPVLVGVSGGADSVALLLGLCAMVPRDASRRLVVLHAEHDLRSAAAADREFVERLCARLGVEVVVRRLAVRAHDGAGDGVEARARRLRHEFFEDLACERGARHVVVGHTADDQAETILHRVLRGTGLRGLAGMRAARQFCPGVALVRPLLGLPRDVVRGYLLASAETWREDESNADPAYARNFLRHEILARCVAGPYPAAAAALVRLGRQAEAVATAVESAAHHLLDAHGRRVGGGAVTLDGGRLAGLDGHLLAAVVEALWRREGWPQRDMTARHYAAVVAAMVGSGPVAFDLPAGVRATRSADGKLTLRRSAES